MDRRRIWRKPRNSLRSSRITSSYSSFPEFGGPGYPLLRPRSPGAPGMSQAAVRLPSRTQLDRATLSLFRATISSRTARVNTQPVVLSEEAHSLSSAKPGLWVMVSGVFLTVTGGAAYAACAPVNSVSTAPSGCVDLAGVLLLGIFLAVIGTIVAIVGHALRTESPPTPPSGVPSRPVRVPSRVAPPPAVGFQQLAPPPMEVTCPYCDYVRSSAYGGCPACGAWSSDRIPVRRTVD